MAGAAVSDFYAGEHCRLQQGKHMQADATSYKAPQRKMKGPRAEHEAQKIEHLGHTSISK